MQTILYTDILLFINYFFLAIALFFLFFYSYRLKLELKRSDVLRKKALRFQKLFQSTSEGVFRCTKKGRFLIINNAGAKLLGYESPEEIIENNLNVSSFFQDSEEKESLMEELFSEGEVNGFLMKTVCKNRECQFLEVSVHLQEEEGEEMFEGIFHDVTHRIRLEKELIEHRDHLEEMVNERTQELEKATKKISKHKTELQSLSAQLIKTQETERSKISHELHDDTGQALTAVKINLEFIKDKLASEDHRIVKDRLTEAITLIDGVMDQIHELALQLRPKMLDELGLVPTLRWFTNRFSQRLDMDIRLKTGDMYDRLAPEMETILYRIVQEAMNNIAKHSEARNVRIDLQRKNSKVSLLIEDDGKGFDVKNVLDSNTDIDRIGLLGIREKVIPLKGHFSIKSKPGKGTRLSIQFPCEKQSKMK